MGHPRSDTGAHAGYESWPELDELDAFDGTSEVDELDELDELMSEMDSETAAPRPTGGVECPPNATPVDCPPKGPAAEVLDRFVFNRSAIIPTRHTPQIERLAGFVVWSQTHAPAVRSIVISGHTDPAGDDNYNFTLGWQRSRAVLATLCQAIERRRPGLTRRLRFEITSCGERNPKTTAPESRRVEIHLRGSPLGGILTERKCGGPGLRFPPTRSVRSEIGAARRVPGPHLAFYEQGDKATNHFRCQASARAKRVNAVESSAETRCGGIGPLPYRTGSDIIVGLRNARKCLGKPIQTVHIFGHSGSDGLYGPEDRTGLYRSEKQAHRDRGARNIPDIPLAGLADDVVFVLHGCNQGHGDSNFARELYEHLAAKLSNPRVFAHHNAGCAGRDHSWREYSQRSPRGTRKPGTLGSLYREGGCCG